MIKNIVVVDIDGTITKLGDRLKYLNEKPVNWDEFYNHCFEDEPVPEIIELVKSLGRDKYVIVFFTGRRESCSKDTTKWIIEHFGPNWEYSGIYFRTNGDFRNDTEVKPEFMRHIDETRVAFILEDRNSMVKKWRELGFTCLQVAEGDF
jgi:hypothetical protein